VLYEACEAVPGNKYTNVNHVSSWEEYLPNICCPWRISVHIS